MARSSSILATAMALISIAIAVSAASAAGNRRLKALVKEPPLVLQYHDGKLLAGDGALEVFTIWYGSFAVQDKAAVTEFLSSFSPSASAKSPSVAASWWKITSGYKDAAGASIFASISNAGQQSIEPAASLGKNLKSSDLESLVRSAIASGKSPKSSLYLVLTAEDVDVEGFCVQSCASHRYISAKNSSSDIAYAWVGNAASRCAGKCAWPFANAKDFGGPDAPPLTAPNGVGIDGVIMNIATVVSGAASNPYGGGYFQGPATAPLEAVTACPGIFGPGAYSGYPGRLLVDAATGASFNAYGAAGRRFLLPALWNPYTSTCTSPTDT